MAQTPHGPLRSFGRTRSRSIKPRQAELMDRLLPRLALDLTQDRLDPRALSPNAAEIWLEIGFGAGEHMVEQAASHGDVLMLGAEPFLNGVASALRHIDARGLDNVRLHPGDARELVARLPDVSIDRVFILFPDPWPKARHRKRRLIQPDFVRALARALKPSGRLRFATDWGDYAEVALEEIQAVMGWTAGRADDWRTPPHDHVATRYERKGLGDIAPVFLDFERLTSN